MKLQLIHIIALVSLRFLNYFLCVVRTGKKKLPINQHYPIYWNTQGFPGGSAKKNPPVNMESAGMWV